jgi:hypothetical protein
LVGGRVRKHAKCPSEQNISVEHGVEHIKLHMVPCDTFLQLVWAWLRSRELGGLMNLDEFSHGEL